MITKGTRVPVKGPCWADLDRTKKAQAGDHVAVAENALYWKGEWLTAIAEEPSRRPVLEVMPTGELELFFDKPDAGYSLGYIVTSGILDFRPALTPR